MLFLKDMDTMKIHNDCKLLLDLLKEHNKISEYISMLNFHKAETARKYGFLQVVLIIFLLL